MMSNTRSQLHMCNMYNTIMKYAHNQEKINAKTMCHTSSTICARCITLVPLSFQHLLDDFLKFIFI